MYCMWINKIIRIIFYLSIKFVCITIKQLNYLLITLKQKIKMANKKDLTNAIALATGKTKKSSKDLVDVIMASIKAELSNGEGSIVKLVNFGTFKVVNRKARKGRNPRTGESINIPSKNVVRFKAGKALKEAVDYTAEEREELGL